MTPLLYSVPSHSTHRANAPATGHSERGEESTAAVRSYRRIRRSPGVSPLLLLVLIAAGFALTLQSGHAETAPSVATANPSPNAAPDAPVAVPEASEKALRYHHGNNYIWAMFQIGGILGPAILVFTGLSARLRTAAQRIGRNWFFTIGVYSILILVLNFVIMLPLEYYIGYVRQHAYGLSNQTISKWFSDSAIGLAVECAMGFLFLWVPYLLGRLSPTRWWLFTSLLITPFIFFQALIWPVWVDPLFNKFGPLDDKNLESKILALAHRAGIEGGRVYEVKKSVDTNAVNAYVTGFGATKRIVLWDTAIAKLKEDELLFVLAHEMGHYVLGHVVKTILLLGAITFGVLYIIDRAAKSLIARFKKRFGFDQISDVASLPLIIMIANTLALVVLPLIYAYSRSIEHEADRFGLELTHSNRAAATAFIALQKENLNVPRHGLFFTVLRSTHPSIGDRIDFCNTYKPWKTGEPVRYEHLFEKPSATTREFAP